MNTLINISLNTIKETEHSWYYLNLKDCISLAAFITTIIALIINIIKTNKSLKNSAKSILNGEKSLEKTEISLANSQKSIRLSIQQAVVKTAIEKAKDCNAIWAGDRQYEREATISELVISTEIINKCIDLYSKNDPDFLEEKSHFAYIFWKQLRTDLRKFFATTAFEISFRHNRKTTYGVQVFSVFIFVESGMEQRKEMDEKHISALCDFYNQSN